MHSPPPPSDEGLHTYTTPHNESLLFNRTFSRGQYFYCKNCKTLLFTECANNTEEAEECTRPCFEYHDDKNKNVTRCASLEMMQAVIFPGDFHSRPKSEGRRESVAPCLTLCLRNVVYCSHTMLYTPKGKVNYITCCIVTTACTHVLYNHYYTVI